MVTSVNKQKRDGARQQLQHWRQLINAEVRKLNAAGRNLASQPLPMQSKVEHLASPAFLLDRQFVQAIYQFCLNDKNR